MRVGSASVSHVPQLDGVRAFSVLCVIAGHALPIGLSQWGLNPSVANAGLALFFVLSGFLIVSFLQSGQPPGEFLTRRVARIVPAFYLYVAMTGVLLGWAPESVLAHLTFVANYGAVGASPGAMHLWTICVEVQFYVCVAVLVATLGRRALWLVGPAALLVTMARVLAEMPFSYLTHLRIDEILAGGTLALVLPRIRPWLQHSGGVALCAVLVLLVALLWASSPGVPLLPYIRPYIAVTLVGMVICSSVPYVTAALMSRPAAFVARISYALYLYHWALLLIVFDGGVGLVRYVLWRPLGLLALVVVAQGSTDAWERPWQRLARRRRDGSPIPTRFPAE